MLRLASSKVVPINAHRAIASSRINLFGPITNPFSSTANNSIENPNLISQYHICTHDPKKLQVDRRLVQVLKSRIRLAKLELSMPATPADFSFPIKDITYYDHSPREIFLGRKLDGEEISVHVTVYSGKPIPEEDSDLSDTDDDINKNNTSSKYSNSKQNEKSLELSVFINKLQDKNNMLLFKISASADTFTIHEIVFMVEGTEKYDGRTHMHYFGYKMDDVESDLQNGVKEYLEIRGIKKTHFGFLYEYSSRKIKQQHLLKKARNFIKEQ